MTEAPALASPFTLQKRTQETVLCAECKKCGMNTRGAKNHFMRGLLNGVPLVDAPPVHEDGYILVLGKAPDQVADEHNDHTRGRDFEFLRKMFYNLKIADRIWWQTSMRCFVPKAKEILPTKGQLGQCKKHLDIDIAVIKPKAIIALGADASAAACGRRDVMAIAGQKIVREDGIPVYPLWSLGYAMREPNRLLPQWGKMWEDVVNKVDDKNLTEKTERIQPVIAWAAKTAELWFTTMLTGMQDGEKLKVTPMAWDMETRGNKQWSALFRIGLISFYHPACEQPLIVPVDHEEAPARYAAYLEANEDEDDTLAPTWSMERRKLLDLVKRVMRAKKVGKTGHNVKFDENGIKAVEGYEVVGFEDDTMNLAYVYNPNRQGHYGLDNLCREMLNLPDYWQEVHTWQAVKGREQSKWDFTIIPFDMLARYAAWDVYATSLLREELLRRLAAQGAEGYGNWFVLLGQTPKRPALSTLEYARHCRKIHHKVTAVLEQNGQYVDTEVIEAVSVYYRQQAQIKEAELLSHKDIVSYGKPINWASPDQVRAFFVDYLHLPVIHETGKGAASTDAYALSVWADKHDCTVAKMLVGFREAKKFLGTYIEPMLCEDFQERLIQPDGCIHPNFKTHSTRSGRLSCANPNSQNMPRGGLVKRLYNSRFKNGWMIQRDYSGLEVRVLALLSRDPSLLNIYRTGGDVHMQTQVHFFGDKADKKDKNQRPICKSSLFGNIYGQGDKGLFDLLTKASVKSPTRLDLDGEHLPISLEECGEFNRKIKEAYPGVASYIEHCHAAARKFKWCSTAFGFVRPLPEMEFYEHWNNNLRHNAWGSPTEVEVRIGLGNAERQSVNSPIQGTAGDLTVYAAYMVHRALRKRKMKSLMVNCVHDSIYVDTVDEEVEEVNALMADIMDNSQMWLPELLPGFDASWMDIPIIGECEIGLDAKDVLSIISECSLSDSSKVLKLKTPTDKEDKFLIPGVGPTLVWGEHKEAIRDYLTPLRAQNMWVGVAGRSLTV